MVTLSRKTRVEGEIPVLRVKYMTVRRPPPDDWMGTNYYCEWDGEAWYVYVRDFDDKGEYGGKKYLIEYKWLPGEPGPADILDNKMTVREIREFLNAFPEIVEKMLQKAETILREREETLGKLRKLREALENL